MVSIGDWMASRCIGSLTWLMRRARLGGMNILYRVCMTGLVMLNE